MCQFWTHVTVVALPECAPSAFFCFVLNALFSAVSKLSSGSCSYKTFVGLRSVVFLVYGRNLNF